MKTIELLEFQVEINNMIRKQSFDAIFEEADIEFLNNFSEFIISKVGQKWLGKSEGRRYLHWQNGSDS